MSQFIPNENKLVTCPYDEAHRMKESRLQLHIAKCKLNHLDLAKKICPFNATHLLPVGEYDHHLITCPDRAPLDRQLAQSVDKNNPFKGRTDVPQYSDPIQHDEVWEVESQTVQLPAAPPGAVLQPGEFSKPSERKRFYSELHQLSSNTENAAAKPAQTVPATKTTHVPPRQPKQHSLIEDSNKPSPQVIETLGLGRGRPVSRIAANFPKSESQSPGNSISYSSVVRDMGNLGLGRGQPNNTNKAPVSIFDDDDDFPALGCGRGIVHKQNVRHPGAKPKN